MDYEEKYKEALERARQFFEKPYLEDSAGIVGYIFPELKESEGERMIRYFKDLAPFDKAEELYEKYGFSHKDAIAWLEKQGEHAKFRDSIQVGDKVTRNEDGVLVNLSQLNRVAKPTDKVEPKFKVGDVVRSSNGASLLIVGITDYCYNCVTCATNDEYSFGFDIQDEFELVEQKPWSEEDEKHIHSIISTIECCKAQYKEAIAVIEQYDSDLDWLKSLRPQSTWKPSDEQMGALWDSIKHNLHLHPVLESLYNDLKKLKG